MAKKVPTYEELLEKHEKQQEYQKTQAAKQSLQAKWARQNGCTVSTEHVKAWMELPDEQKKSAIVNDFIAKLDKKEGTEAPDDQEPGAQVA